MNTSQSECELEVSLQMNSSNNFSNLEPEIVGLWLVSFQVSAINNFIWAWLQFGIFQQHSTYYIAQYDVLHTLLTIN